MDSIVVVRDNVVSYGVVTGTQEADSTVVVRDSVVHYDVVAGRR